MDISGSEIAKLGLPRGPFDIARIKPGDVPTWPVLWAHQAARETQMVVIPDRAGVVRQGCDSRAIDTWQRTASRLHFNRDFRINSQPLTACLTPELSIGGTAWPNFLCSDLSWETPIVCWANTTLGLICFWWIGTRQQEGRAQRGGRRLLGVVVGHCSQARTIRCIRIRSHFGSTAPTARRTDPPAAIGRSLSRGGPVLTFARLVDLVCALVVSCPLAAGAGAVPGRVQLVGNLRP